MAPGRSFGPGGKECAPKPRGKIMIRSLRQRHRHVFAVLTVILPAVLVAGVAARRPVPAIESLPDALMPKAATFTGKVWSRDDLFSKSAVRVVLQREREKGAFAVQLSVSEKFIEPDLLVYWSAGSSGATKNLPDDAVLLGVFNGSLPLRLPSERSVIGTLILYSLADGEIVDISKPVTLQ